MNVLLKQVSILALLSFALGGIAAYLIDARSDGVSAAKHSTPVIGDGVRTPAGMVWIAGGDFAMGSDDELARQNEKPVHRVRVHGFWMDRHQVTNAEFQRFVTASGYVTTAERAPNWDEIKQQLPP